MLSLKAFTKKSILIHKHEGGMIINQIFCIPKTKLLNKSCLYELSSWFKDIWRSEKWRGHIFHYVNNNRQENKEKHMTIWVIFDGTVKNKLFLLFGKGTENSRAEREELMALMPGMNMCLNSIWIGILPIHQQATIHCPVIMTKVG